MGYLFRKDRQDKRGKWSDVVRSLIIVLVLFMGFRWILFEPFVIPSSSMEQTLLVQDYVLVKKWAYGLRIPFTETWIVGPQTPERGDIVVFKATDESGHFIVKRVVGLPGDSIKINEQGFVSINSVPFQYRPVETANDHFNIYNENNGEKSYRVQWVKDYEQAPASFNVPPGHLFMMGDNRNHSADSRYWGPLPIDRIVGKLVVIWLSCKESESYSSFLCSPSDFRMERIFKTVE